MNKEYIFGKVFPTLSRGKGALSQGFCPLDGDSAVNTYLDTSDEHNSVNIYF